MTNETTVRIVRSKYADVPSKDNLRPCTREELKEFLAKYPKPISSNMFMDTFTWYDPSIGNPPGAMIGRIYIAYEGDDTFAKLSDDDLQRMSAI